MSAIAKVLYGRGVEVTGSDREPSIYSHSLEAMGIPVHYGHAAGNIDEVDLVVASSAIPEDNVEISEAQRRGIIVQRRNAFLPDLTKGFQTLAVAGTHGKTTTTGWIAWLMMHADLDPTFMVGGIVQDLDTNARAGDGQYFVIEADEYDRAFLGLKPSIAVVTNIEHDHPDCYPTSADFYQAFVEFAAQVQDTLVVCEDDEQARTLPSQRALRVSYGLAAEADWRAEEVRPNPAGGSDFLVVNGDQTLGLARTRLPGLHNVRNALAAIAVLAQVGVQFSQLRDALTEYQGIGRRFQILGVAGGITVIDDYAHHPTEIRATLQAARERYPEAEIWAVFQPHTYSRLRALIDDFSMCFADADHVVVTDVFAAREDLDPEFSGAQIAQRITHSDVKYRGDHGIAASLLADHVKVGSVVITLSAGDGNQVGVLLLEKIKENEGEQGHG
jgi:UDP-N-acetylmuramate--alanine ligase